MAFQIGGFRSARATLTGAAIFGATLASFPAAAQQLSSNETSSPACAGIADATAGIKCEIKESEKRTQAYKDETKAARERAAEAEARTKDAVAKGKAADARSEQARIVNGCATFLLNGVKSGAFIKAEVLGKAGGKVTDDNACEVARSYGYNKKAEAAPLPH